MKEFKFCGEITEYVEIPVTIFESQKELVEQISGVIRDAKDLGMGEEESIYVIYKDGSKYFVYDEEEIGKFKRYGIKAAVYEHVNGYEVYGNFAVTGNGDISIEESDIEEYGVYNGQYDVKEESETVVETVETEEKAEKDTIKATYEFTKKADIQACKELARTMIKRDIAVNGEACEANYYEYMISKFFNCTNIDFRIDFTNWIYKHTMLVRARAPNADGSRKGVKLHRHIRSSRGLNLRRLSK